MTPSVLARQLQDNLLDYIRATLDLEDEAFTEALLGFLGGNDGLFRGPYLRLGLPFASAEEGAPNPLEIRPDFTPYAHQLQAFRQLDSRGAARNTLVTTGTGSGKTECFLYPILDHCWRHRDTPGVQAILIYPMNALATDQARRFAQAVHADPRLEGLRVGLYVGGAGSTTAMGPEQVIEDKQTLRANPPHVLLTNYKMLDFMLLRPDERALWAPSGPETLRYLVIDELHTFDGAQGSDVACLIRRLKARLGTPEGRLICAGTSATIGSAADPETFRRLCDFAETVFGEPFSPEHVVKESRVTRARFLAPTARAELPDARGAATLAALEPGADAEAWLAAQQRLWLGEVLDPMGLGEALRAHPLTRHLLALADAAPVELPALRRQLGERMAEWGRYDEALQARLLDSFLALVSAARREEGGRPRPFLTVQVQLWSRELTRLLRALPDRERGGVLPPRFAWWTELPGYSTPDGLWGPQAHCRECGVVGFAALETEADRQKKRLTWEPAAVGQAWLNSDPGARFLWPRPLEGGPAEIETWWLDPVSGTWMGEEPVDADGRRRGVPVRVEATLSKTGPKRFLARCPACEEDNALRILGARAASLSAVVVTQLFQSDFHREPKLLAFTDSVQDACHRAGFFGGRSFRIHLRTAMQAVIEAEGPLPLDRAGEAFVDFWEQRLGPEATLGSFLPPDLRELPELEAWEAARSKKHHARLRAILVERLGWEFTREFGLMAGVGRSLERTATSSLAFEPARLGRARERFAAWVREDGLAGPDARPGHFLYGLLHRLRQQGGVHHPYLLRFVRSLGNRYLLTRKQNPHISPMPPGSRRPRFLAARPGKSFSSPFGRRSHLGWTADWLKRSLDWPNASDDDRHRAWRQALAILVDEGLLRVESADAGVDTWGLEPGALLLTAEVGAVRSGRRGRLFHLPLGEAEAAADQPSWVFRDPDPLRQIEPQPGYYAQVYRRPTSTRIYPGEHTGLLDRGPRTLLEQRFLACPDPDDLQAPNLLVCTPTLEMGVDIGDLSATMLCSVPPTPANYLQRVGRAGRKTGNALIFTLATAQPHDLYFHAAPDRMLDGVVQPPGVFLGAAAMLRRQLTAWVMDRWAEGDEDAVAIPQRAWLLKGEGQTLFPGPLLAWLATHREALLAGFLERFDAWIRPEASSWLEAWVRSELHGMQRAIPQAFEELFAEIDEHQSTREKARKRIKKLEDDPTLVGDAAQEIKELKRFRGVLGALVAELKRRYPLNVLAERSLLPNYAFPESGVELQSLLGSTTDEDGQPKRSYDKRVYVRPAARALRELAPFSTFYAEGHKVLIRQLELGPKASNVRHYRFCPACHHRSRKPVDPLTPATEPACPSCGAPGWADKGQVRALLPLSTVRSVSDRLRSTTVDDTEEREQERYHVVQVFDVLRREGAALLHQGLGFGFEYIDALELTELNTSLESQADAGSRLQLAGELVSADGFGTCPDCGTVHDPRPQPGVRNPKPMHSPFCPKRDKPVTLTPLYLARSVTSEALRFLLPFSEVDVEGKLRSFQAALAFGLRLRFQGRPIHLQVGTMSEPVQGSPQQRKYFLVLFDAVPGGTGYLREYREPEVVFDLLERTLGGLRACPCRAEGRDGCYLCLFAHQSQRHLAVLSSRKAEDMLARVLEGREGFEREAGGLSGTDVASVLESELEERFITWLGSWGDLTELPDDKQRWALRVGDSGWLLEGQVDVSAEAGQGARADFVFTGTTGPAMDQRVVVECDGLAYHVGADPERFRLDEDVRKRQALASRPGWRVFSLTWNDLDSSKEAVVGPAALCGADGQTWHAVHGRALLALPAALRPLLAKLPESTPASLLRSYLEHPLPQWDVAVAAMGCAALVSALRQKASHDAWSGARLRDHLLESEALSPLPGVNAAGRPGPRDPVVRFVAEGDCAALLRTDHQALLTRFEPGGLTLVLRLDDRPERRADGAAFAAAWRRFLHGLNLSQFLPEVTWMTSALVEPPAVDEAVDPLQAFGLVAEPEAEVWEAAPEAALQEVLEALLDDETRGLIRGVHALGGPLPNVDPVEIPGETAAEITWGWLKLAVAYEGTLEPADRDALAAAGWTLRLLPMSPEDLLRTLTRLTRELKTR
ncbi:MAG: DEAD/DEAH box helicase [Alphaproteobacteria bacterium]|nr:DEAD/DEAH box helicase [Alphaproteobacteria bacterium]MCB9795320.1 DEAD/DEAH box helicase [Alphaproteobacteria bacterium]